MNKSMSVVVTAGIALAMLGSDAIAATSPDLSHHHLHKAHVAKHYKHSYSITVIILTSIEFYSRPGPLHGYRFGFSTYPGDPFYSDDYFDGRRCYYLHHRDFCRGPKSLDWLRW